MVTGAINASTFNTYKGKRIIYTGSDNVEFDLPNATGTSAVGDTWVIVNASQFIITLDPDPSDTIKIATGSTYTGSGAGVNAAIARGGVAELVVVADNELAIFGSGISQ